MKNKTIFLLVIGLLLAFTSAATPRAQLGQYSQSTSLNIAEYIPAGGSTQTFNLVAAPKQIALQPAWNAFGITNTGSNAVYVSNNPDANSAIALAVVLPGSTIYRTCSSTLWAWSPLGSSVSFTGYIKRTTSAKAPWLAAGGLRPCADYLDLATGATGNQYKDSNDFARVQYTTSGAVTRLELVYPGWYVHAAATYGDTPNPNTEHIQAAIEYPAGTFTRVTFRGSNSHTLDPNGYVISDPVFIAIPAQTAFFVRTYKELTVLYSGTLNTGAAAGGTLVLPPQIANDPALVGATLVITGGTGAPTSTNARNACKVASTSVVSGLVNITQDSTLKTSSTTDSTSTFSIYASPSSAVKLTAAVRTDNDQYSNGYQHSGFNYVTTAFNSGDVTTGTGQFKYEVGPVAVLGDSSVPSVALFGDSIASGNWNSGNQSVNSNGGYCSNFLDDVLFKTYGVPNFGLVKLTESGGHYFDYAAGGFARRLAVGALADYAIVSYGTNDIWSGQTLAQLQANSVAMWTALANAGVQVYACTVVPRTTDSAGLWISQATQTIDATHDPIRQAYNTWLRTVPAPLSGVFDTAANVEANSSNVLTLNGGYWYVGPNVAINTGVTTSLATGGTSTTLVDTVNLPTDRNYHFLGSVIQVTHGGVNYTGIITAYTASSQTITCSAGFSSGYTPVAGDPYVLLGNTASALTGALGVHPNDYGSLLMSAAVNTALFTPVARIDLGVFGALTLKLSPKESWHRSLAMQSKTRSGLR